MQVESITFKQLSTIVKKMHKLGWKIRDVQAITEGNKRAGELTRIEADRLIALLTRCLKNTEERKRIADVIESWRKKQATEKNS